MKLSSGYKRYLNRPHFTLTVDAQKIDIRNIQQQSGSHKYMLLATKQISVVQTRLQNIHVALFYALTRKVG
jgi:hypothetical protein